MKDLREIKNLEHRRKEIENRVAAARLLQQVKSGSLPVESDDQMGSEEDLSRWAVLKAIDTICTQEMEKRDQDTKYVPQTFASLWRRRREELVGAGDTTSSEVSLRSIILAEAEAGLNETSSDLASDASVSFAIHKQIWQPRLIVAEVVGAIAKPKVDEDEKQQADAVRDDFLSGTSIDTKKNASKSVKKTSKANKRKNKTCRKVKDPKAACGDD